MMDVVIGLNELPAIGCGAVEVGEALSGEGVGSKSVCVFVDAVAAGVETIEKTETVHAVEWIMVLLEAIDFVSSACESFSS